MEDLFELMTTTGKSDTSVSVQLGIHLKIAGHETLCPVSRTCESYEAFEKESQVLKDRLEQVKQKARTLFESPSSSKAFHIAPDTPPQEIWSILSTLADETALVDAFNDLGETQRQAVAEYVLTQCNIFSGKAAIFSKRYDNASGLMT